MQHSTGKFGGVRGTPIFTQCWLPDGPARAVILLAHGIGEHSGRYAHVAAQFVERGCAVYALDHRGHGHSGGERVQVDAFADYVHDMETYYGQVRADHPDLPVFVLGHSMGSLIALLFAERRQADLAGLILTGTPLTLMMLNRVTRYLLRLLARAAPRLRLIPILARWISRDPAARTRYRQDPLVYESPLPLGIIQQVVQAGAASETVLPALRVPVLALHGGDDPLALPASVRSVEKRSGSSDTTVIVYPGLRHEVLNEPEQKQVLADLMQWLEARLDRSSRASGDRAGTHAGPRAASAADPS